MEKVENKEIVVDENKKVSYLQLIQKEKNKNQMINIILKVGAFIVNFSVLTSLRLRGFSINHYLIILPMVLIMVIDLYFGYLAKYYDGLYESIRLNKKEIDFDITPYYYDDFITTIKGMTLGFINIPTWIYYILLVGISYLVITL